jgi:hypothetical protein
METGTGMASETTWRSGELSVCTSVAFQTGRLGAVPLTPGLGREQGCARRNLLATRDPRHSQALAAEEQTQHRHTPCRRPPASSATLRAAHGAIARTPTRPGTSASAHRNQRTSRHLANDEPRSWAIGYSLST